MDENGDLTVTEKTAAVPTEQVLHGMKQFMPYDLIDGATFGADALSAEGNFGPLGVVAANPRLLSVTPCTTLNRSHPQPSREKQQEGNGHQELTRS